MNEFKQKQMKPSSETGSFINMLMSGNSTVPKVGEGATVLLWTDRHAYEVIEVSPNMKRVTLQQYNPKRIDTNGMGDNQIYEYKELYPEKTIVVWKWNAWREEQFADDSGEKKTYSKINIIFGIKDEHYDFSF